jgi:non-ribosomal peptide synthetase component F
MPVTLSSKPTEQVVKISQELGSTLHTAMIALLSIYLAVYAKRDDIVVSSVFMTRDREELEPLIGYFNNLLVLRNNIDLRNSLIAQLMAVHRNTLDAYDHWRMPFAYLHEKLPSDGPGLPPRPAQIMFNFVHANAELTLPGLAVSRKMLSASIPVEGELLCDMCWQFYQAGSEIHGFILYNTSLYDAKVVADLAAGFTALATALLHDPTTAIAAIAERSR